MLLLHGAGATAQHGLDLLIGQADDAGLILVVPRARRRACPRLFLSHGTRDRVLPIDACSRRLLPELRQTGYQVRYRESQGGHTIPPAIVLDAVTWLGSPAPDT